MTATVAPVAVDLTAALTPASTYGTKLAAEAAAKVAADRKQGGLKDLQEGRQDIFRLNPFLIVVKPGFNSRNFNDPAVQEHVDGLAQSIAQIGVKESLTVAWENGAPTLTDGECRLRATIRAIEVYGAEIKTVPVKTEDRSASAAEKVLMQLVRNAGRPFTPFEKSATVKKLNDLGWSKEDIAQKAGMTVTYVNQLLDFQSVSEDVKVMVGRGEISLSNALDLIRKGRSEGNEDAAVDQMKDAVGRAKAAGKARASKKHIEPKARTVSARKEIAGIIAEVEARDGIENVGRNTNVTFTKAEWKRLREIVGL